MKHFGCLMEYSEDRKNDLLRAYRQHMYECRMIRMQDVYTTIVNMPSSRFWVSEVRAAAIVKAMMHGKSILQHMWPLRREMYEEIFRRVMRLRECHPAKSISELCAIVVSRPAPKFYISPISAKKIICKERNKWKAERLKR